MNARNPRFVIEYASAQDDADLRTLLRENPFGEKISLSYEREPNMLNAATLEGENHRFLITRDTKLNKICAMAGYSFYNAWLNGEQTRIGYLSQLRVAAYARGNPSFLAKGYLKTVEDAARVKCPFYVTTIISDNVLARRFLEAQKPGFPHYIKRGMLHTLAIPLWRVPQKAKTEWRGRVRRGEEKDKAKIAQFLLRELKTFQFAPVCDEAVLWDSCRSRGLRVEDFLLAEEDNDLVGCLALWDQTAFKQIVVRGYSPMLRFGRPLLNVLAPLLGTVQLPAIDNQFRYIFFAHAAAVNTDILCRLIADAMEQAKAAGFSYATLGMSATHPSLSRVRSLFSHLNYESIIYTVHHESMGPEQNFLPQFPPHLEIARI
jgi:hypothetical protein